ncbi:MAG: type II secretion system protein [Chthonomonadetes bacterium]|nr:type II secretion system protein [Chthonomonadetes bacterium]
MIRVCNKTNRQAFSLIEVMVVISIIATLSALLYPVVSHSLRRTYVTSCQSQLHQIGQAIKMYQADYQSEDWPCRLSALAPQYLSESLYVCPWANRVAGGAISRLQEQWKGKWISYFVFCRRGLDDLANRDGSITFTEIMMERGERTPMVICREHREPFTIRSNYPIVPCAWDFPEAPVVVLRKDGSVDLSMKGGTQCHFTFRDTLADAWEL